MWTRKRTRALSSIWCGVASRRLASSFWRRVEVGRALNHDLLGASTSAVPSQLHALGRD